MRSVKCYVLAYSAITIELFQMFDKLLFEVCHSSVNLCCRYRALVLIFTFFIYTAYHLSRKPISVVKVCILFKCKFKDLLLVHFIGQAVTSGLVIHCSHISVCEAVV